MKQNMERTPAAQEGLSAEAISQYVQQMSDCNVHAYMISRNGRVVAEGAFAPHQLERPHTIYSLTKTIQALAVGLAVSEYGLKLDDLVAKFFPDYQDPRKNPVIQKCTVRNLLTMNCGLPCEHSDHDFYESKDWVEEFFTTATLHEPGTYFEYDNRCAYMLSAIVTKVTGQSVAHLLQEAVFTPMGIEDVYWESDKNGISQGGWGIQTSLETITKLGNLFLNDGTWNGHSLVSRDWVQQCLSVQVSTNRLSDASKQYGYGYQVWKGAPKGVWCGRGAFGQLCIICQEQNMVISTFAGSQDYNDLLQATWDFLDQVDQKKQDCIAGKELIATENQFKVEAVKLNLGTTDRLELKVNGTQLTLNIGHGAWERNLLPVESIQIMETLAYRNVACRSHWENQDYVLELSYLDTPYTDEVRVMPGVQESKVVYRCYPQIRLRGGEYQFTLRCK